ncbi:hypothetical protein [Petroclostridium sp. X23]|uniref:hypothetical protein n=1 Tax=Petroclostridium sp. X23 TaxID=3045146 RepID=UPI0024AD145A|nr:hypothetical protein [Petroclostridium sp. X23]WHH60415.1 hypothetical protein QKW49_06735 [Petroclostridium sp. X23]
MKIEPELQSLYNRALLYRGSKCHDFCANRVWYGKGGLKQKLCTLVGFDANKPELVNSEAYDIAYRKIYNALPTYKHLNGGCGA